MSLEIVTLSKKDLEAMLRAVVREELDARDRGDLLTKPEVEAEYKWSASTINRYMKLGMPSEGPGRPKFRRSKIDAWLENQRNSN